MAFQVFGAKNYPYPVAVSQPDGSVIHINIFGDESFSYKMSANGYLIAQGEDGYYYYVSYTPSGCIFSDKKVTDSGIGVSKTVPNFTCQPKQYYPKGESFDFQQYNLTKGRTVIKSLVIPVQFIDKRFITEDIHSKIFNLFNQLNYSYDGATGSVTDYFKDNLQTYGDFVFDIAPVVTVRQKESYYGANSNLETDSNIQELVKDACQALASRVDFTDYDGNGDGVIDNVIIFFAGYNEAEGGGDYTLWPQSWRLDQSFSVQGMTVSGFSCCSELSGSSGSHFTGIGTICHEYCHFLGLRDMYDVNGKTDGLSNGLLGTTSIMDYGNYNNEGKTPPYFNSIEREIVGMASFVKPSVNSQYEIEPVYQSNRVVRIDTDNNGEYFVIEYRDGSKWDRYIGGEGMLLYHIDKSDNPVGGSTASKRWYNNIVNTNSAHPGAYIVSNSGTQATNPTEAFFPGKNNITSIVSNNSFPLLGWDGNGVGIGIENLEYSSNGFSVRIVKDESWSLPVINGIVVHPSQTTAKLEWDVNRESDSGNWVIIWSAVSSISQETLYVKDKNVVLENLIPGEMYSGKIFFKQGSVIGKESTFEFRTIERISEFPLIAVLKGGYKKGDVFELTLLNLIEPYKNIQWTVNGGLCKEKNYTCEESGDYLIIAKITYEDGSEEFLEKRLTVQ